MGISAQILILPSIDSIFGFALFFAAGTAIAAWFATSSPRLSSFGVQMALSFYFVNLQDFHAETDLTIARDKVVGVLLGILAMGFIFDRFGTKSDAEQLQKLLVRNLRMLAQLAVCPVARGKGIAASRSAVSAARSMTTSPAWNRRWTPCGLSLSFAIGAKKTLLSVSGFRGLSRRCVRSFCWNSLFSHIVGDRRSIPN